MLMLICAFIAVIAIVYQAWNLLSYKPYLDMNEYDKRVDEVVKTIVDEINTALSLGQYEVVHKFNPAELTIDGEIAATITYEVAKCNPYVINFIHELNGDVKITLTGEI
jgi:hypothetical protein